MLRLDILQTIKREYESGTNIISYLKNIKKQENNSIEDIMISYDFQAGKYNEEYVSMNDFYKKFHRTLIAEISKVVEKIGKKDISIMEAGVGDGTSFVSICKGLRDVAKERYAFDISWSRVKCCDRYCNKEGIDAKLFVGDLMNMPISNNGVNLVYTVHAVEPNGGNEKTILEELMRVTKDYLVMFEPIYELADETCKRYMEKHGYVRNLKVIIEELGYKIVKYELLDKEFWPGKTNPTGIIVVKKCSEENTDNVLCDPLLKTSIRRYSDSYFSKESMLAYPIIGGIPCLTTENAIVATHYGEYI